MDAVLRAHAISLVRRALAKLVWVVSPRETGREATGSIRVRCDRAGWYCARKQTGRCEEEGGYSELEESEI